MHYNLQTIDDEPPKLTAKLYVAVEVERRGGAKQLKPYYPVDCTGRGNSLINSSLATHHCILVSVPTSHVL